MQHNQLLPERGILRLKPAFRLERRRQNGQQKADERDHCASLADIGASVNVRMRDSARTSAFLANHAPHIAAMDLFVVPTIGFALLYAFVIVRLDRRTLVWTNGARHPTADWIARQITEAFPWDEARRYLIRDRDGVFGAVVTRRLRAMGIRDKPIAPASPWQNAFAERLIGSIRRECVSNISLSWANGICVVSCDATLIITTK